MGRIGFLCAALLIASCSTKSPKGRTEAETLFREAEKLVERKRYIMATESLNQLRSRYPYSFYATRAELMLADIYFLQENYVEAAAAYILFRDFHPKHKEMARIISQIAESFFLQTPSTFDRDLSSGSESIKYYNEVVQKYSKTKYAKLAKERMAEAQKMLDQKEKYIADFYFKTEVYFAARYRYLEILKIVKNIDIRVHAMERVIESSYHLKEYEKCIFYINQYFSKLKKESRERLKGIKTNCLSKRPSKKVS